MAHQITIERVNDRYIVSYIQKGSIGQITEDVTDFVAKEIADALARNKCKNCEA